MTTTLCHGCGAVLSDGTRHCTRCRQALMDEVRNSHDLLRDLDVTLSRQDRVAAPHVGGRSPHTPTAYHVGASMAAAELRASIRAMAASPDVTHTHITRFRSARAHALTVVDIPDPRIYIGVCPCGASLYARLGEADVKCRVCREVWTAEPPDVWAELRKLSAPVPRLREWLMTLGVMRSRAQLYRDVASLRPVGDTEPRAYLLADVYAAIAAKTADRIRA